MATRSSRNLKRRLASLGLADSGSVASGERRLEASFSGCSGISAKGKQSPHFRPATKEVLVHSEDHLLLLTRIKPGKNKTQYYECKWFNRILVVAVPCKPDGFQSLMEYMEV